MEYDVRKLMSIANETLERLSFTKEGPKFVLWKTPFYDLEVFVGL